MSDFTKIFSDRLQEIDAYLALLETLEQAVRSGSPRFTKSETKITPQQQHILYSSFYLQLYNLVEATITRCIEAFTTSVFIKESWFPADLSVELRKEWVRYIARTHSELNRENRLAGALRLCDHFIQSLPVSEFNIDKGGGGNWDEEKIQKIASRLGLSLQISKETNEGIKRQLYNDKGALVHIKDLRNELAHGSLSFAECGRNVTVRDLRDLKKRIVAYLEEVIASFQRSINNYEFLSPDKRPR
ncbi:MAG: hypothetical protein EI684_15225 [Candidatus Viridilinea halotolerans]|uniref:MAE-28990/MAE-18760-like HEPN domain-containing protein n=1 Tax=Candidatus Viridilinea halotolerans TaxID=2491704 RepID=A0A426TVW8_9CHLR|nr:MAG: hypothetical protein EI684_15225 [Candidatus Viridilinea halotolerans]